MATRQRTDGIAESFSLSLFYLISRICSEGACTLKGSINFDNIPAANGVSFWCIILGGLTCANSCQSMCWWLQGRNPTTNSFL